MTIDGFAMINRLEYNQSDWRVFRRLRQRKWSINGAVKIIRINILIDETYESLGKVSFSLTAFVISFY